MKITGIAAAALSTVFMGVSIVIGSVVSKRVDPFVLAMLLYAFAIPFILIIGLMREFQINKLFTGFKKELLQIFIPRTLISQFLIIYGLSLTIAIRATFITRLEPVFVFIFSVLLIKEKVKKTKLALLGILIFGAFLLVTNGSIDIFSEVLPGDLILILALAFLSYTYIPSARIMKKINTPTLLIVLYIMAVIVLLPVVLLFFSDQLIISTYDLILILAYSITFHVLGISLWFIALRETKPWVVASMLSLTPIVGSVVAFLWLGQFLLPIQLVGGSIIILTTYFIGRENDKV